MAKTSTYSFDTSSSATVISGFGPFEFKAGNYSEKSDASAANQIVLTNNTSPSDRQELITFGCTPIPDYYKKSGLNPHYIPANRHGVQVLVKSEWFKTTVDSTDPDYMKINPQKMWICFQTGTNELTTADDMLLGLRQVVGALLGEDATSDHINKLIRHALKPAGVV